MAGDSPLGVGLGTYPAVLIQRFGFPFWPTPAHNLFFEILAEAGIFGLVFFILLVARVYFEYVRTPRKKDDALRYAAFLGLTVFLLGAQFYPFFNSSWLFELFWLLAAVMLY